MPMLRRSWLAIVLALAATQLSYPLAAQLASRPAAEWTKTLEAPERVASLKIAEVIAAMKLKPGQVVADLGAGTGLFALPLAKAVGPSGTVYAVELDEGFLTHINGRAQEQSLANVRTVLGKFTDPSLPARDVDVAFFHDVLHHVENRSAYLKSVVGYLKPGGRVVIIDYNAAQSPHRDQPALVVSKEQANAWLADAGLVPVEDVPLFTDKWFVAYSRR